MVLPGIQALFGFQLIAVFSPGFRDLDPSLQRVDLGAIVQVTIAIVLIMTPAALHRAWGSSTVTSGFVRISSRLLLASMAPLATAISLEVYLIALVIAGNGVALGLAGGVLALFVLAWFVLPRVVCGKSADTTR